MNFLKKCLLDKKLTNKFNYLLKIRPQQIYFLIFLLKNGINFYGIVFCTVYLSAIYLQLNL